MRKILKALLLSAMVIGTAVGCEWGKSSETTASSSSEHSTVTMPSSITSSYTSSIDSTSDSTSSTTSIAPVLTGITLNTENVKKSYVLGEALDLTGLVVTANYSDNSSNAVTGYTVNPANGSQLNLGNNTITVTYEGKTATFTVTTKQAQSIIINTANAKTSYEQGEQLDTTGLVVTVTYSDNTSATVTDYTTDPANGTVLNEIGEFKVKVSTQGIYQMYDIFVTRAIKRAWTEEESALMAEHLNGEVLPFTGYEESVVAYDSQNYMITIKGGAYEEGFLASYANKLAAAGYEKYMAGDAAIGYEKEFAVGNGVRHVYVFATFEDGQLSIQAYDPYYYSFPSDFAAWAVNNYFGSLVSIPAVDANFYEIDDQRLYIFCYMDSATDDAGYSALLRDAGFSIQADKDSDGYYVAVSPDGSYAVAYLYANGVLRIYFEPVNFWNSALIDQFFIKYGGEPVEIPAINVEGAQYQFLEWDRNEMAAMYGAYEYIHAFMIVYGASANDAEVYAEILDQAGWEVEGSNGYYSAKFEIFLEGIARIEFNYDSDAQALVVTIYFQLDPIPEVNWPAAQIAELLGDEVTEVVPEYTGANKGFVVLNDDQGTAVVVQVDKGTEIDAVAAYAAILKAANYKEAGADAQGDMRYVSENGQILVTPYYATSGSFTIAFKKAPLLAFPSDKIEEAFDYAQDTVPAAEGALEYTFQISGRNINIACTYATNDAAKAAYAEYIVALGEAGYTYLGADSDKDPHYDSKNSEFEVCPYIRSSSTFYISILGPKDPGLSWPYDKLVEKFGKDIADQIPVYEGGSYYGVLPAKNFYEIMVTVEDAEAALAEYIEILTNAGFTTTYEDEFGDTHYCKGVIDIAPWWLEENELDIDIVIKEEVTSKWPGEAIAEYFQDNGFTDPLPAYEGECEDITAGTDYSGNFTIFIDAEDNHDQVYTAYLSALDQALFTYDYDNSTDYDDVFKSPNGQYSVTVTNSRIGVNLTIKSLGGGTQGGSNEFPMADVNEYFPQAADYLPKITDENVTFSSNYFWGEVCIRVTYGDADSAAAGLAAYIQALGTAGFKEATLWESYDVYMLDSDQSFAIMLDDADLADGMFDIIIMETYM